MTVVPRNPTRPVALLDQIKIKQEPRALLGRYFLMIDETLFRRKIVFRRSTFAELAAVYEEHHATWNGLAPVFDCRASVVPDESAVCFIGYDPTGLPMTTMAARYFDLRGRSIKAALEDLSFWYGADAATWRSRVSSKVECASAATITNRIFYPGGFWVRPDYRGTGLGYLIPDVARYYALSQWLVDHEVSVGARAFNRPEIQKCYNFERHENGFELWKDHKPMLHGLLLSSHVEHLYRRLESIVRSGKPEMASVDERGSQQSLAGGADR